MERHAYIDEYNKVRDQYLSLKNNQLKYKFVYFKGYQQREFITNHQEEIIRILKGCVPLNNEIISDNKKIKKKYTAYIKKLLKVYAYSGDAYRWYFVMSNKKIACLCFVGKKAHFYKTKNNNLESYTIYRTDNSSKLCELQYGDDCLKLDENVLRNMQNNIISEGPVIYSLCKDQKYPKVGKFILDNLFQHLKKNNNHVYLIQESILFKDNYSNIFGFNSCHFVDYKKYQSSNRRLSRYYKSIGLEVLKNYYDIYYCVSRDTNIVHYIFFNIFYKRL